MPPSSAERRQVSSRLPNAQRFLPQLLALSSRRRAAPLLFVEIAGMGRAEPARSRLTRLECKRVVAAALKTCIGTVLRTSDLIAAGPTAEWFAALLVDRAVRLGSSRHPLEDASLGTVASRVRAEVQRSLEDAQRRGMLPRVARARAGWTFIEPVHPSRALQELRQALRGAAVVARVEEQRATVLASITHELRTPLTSIVGYAERLTRAAVGEDLRKREAGIIAQEARRLNRLVDGLIDLGAWTASNLRLRTTILDVRDVLDDAARVVSPIAAERRVTLSARGHAMIEADRERAAQIFINLLDNAVRHCDEGGRVRVVAAARSGTCAVTVCDDGPGFDERALRHLGQPFAATPHGRVGLGLSIAHLLARAHGGTLKLANRRPKGGVACVELPLASYSGDKGHSKRLYAGANRRL